MASNLPNRGDTILRHGGLHTNLNRWLRFCATTQLALFTPCVQFGDAEIACTESKVSQGEIWLQLITEITPQISSWVSKTVKEPKFFVKKIPIYLYKYFFSPLGGANNPFLQNASYAADGSRIEGDPAQGQYYGAGYSQAQSGYSSSGFGK